MSLSSPPPNSVWWSFRAKTGERYYAFARTAFFGRQYLAVHLGCEPGQLESVGYIVHAPERLGETNPQHGQIMKGASNE